MKLLRLTDREYVLMHDLQLALSALAWAVGRFEGLNVDSGYAGETLTDIQGRYHADGTIDCYPTSPRIEEK